MTHHAEVLHSAEHAIVRDLKDHPTGYESVFKELHKLREQDGSARTFTKDLNEINQKLHDQNLLPQLYLVESADAKSGFDVSSLPPSLKDSGSDSSSASSSNATDLSRATRPFRSSGGGGGGESSLRFRAGSPFSPFVNGWFNPPPLDTGGSSDGTSSSGSSDESESSGNGDSTNYYDQPAQDLPSDVPSGSLAAAIIKAGENVGGEEGTHGYCLRGVLDSLDSIGIRLPRRAYAYQEAQDFARDKSQFEEISPSAHLKPGDIIVHGKTAHNPYGHIAIVLPNGKESSDHVAALVGTAVTNSYGPARVFRPIARKA